MKKDPNFFISSYSPPPPLSSPISYYPCLNFPNNDIISPFSSKMP